MTTIQEAEALGEQMQAAIKKYVGRKLAPLEQRIRELEADATPVRLGGVERAVAALLTMWPGARAANSGQVKSANELLEMVDQLRDRIATLESRSSLQYMGVWNAGTQFVKGNVVSDHGSAWHCNRPTRSRPADSSDWTLMVKRGSEGKGFK